MTIQSSSTMDIPLILANLDNKGVIINSSLISYLLSEGVGRQDLIDICLENKRSGLSHSLKRTNRTLAHLTEPHH